MKPSPHVEGEYRLERGIVGRVRTTTCTRTTYDTYAGAQWAVY
jgi:hypothetical protein